MEGTQNEWGLYKLNYESLESEPADRTVIRWSTNRLMVMYHALSSVDRRIRTVSNIRAKSRKGSMTRKGR